VLRPSSGRERDPGSADTESGTEAPRQAIRALVNEVFDYWDGAARALGPAWQSRTPAQQTEFVRLFADFIERGYVAFIGAKASVTGGLKIRYLEESVTGDSAAVATSLLTCNGSDLDVDHLMIRRGGRWMVRDVVVDGMSLIANYRAQFNRILNTPSYTELLRGCRAIRLRSRSRLLPRRRCVPVAQVAMVAQVPKIAPGAAAPAPTVAQPATAAAQPAKPTSPPAVVVPAVTAPPVARQEFQLAARHVEVSAPKVEVIRVSEPEPAIPVQAAPKGASGVAASHYWIQVGAFRTVGPRCNWLNGRCLGGGLNDPLTSAPGHPAALARCAWGPFATHSDAKSNLRALSRAATRRSSPKRH
jgi:phospholipid transport system substrate-binding protein